MSDFTLCQSFSYDVAVISVTGGCDARGARETEDVLDRLIADGYRKYVLDVSGLSFVETPGFRMIIRKVGELQDIDGGLVVVGLSGRVARAFNLLKLGTSVPVAQDVRSAIAEIGTVQDLRSGTYG